MRKGIFLTGTGTGVGKTVVCSLLISALQQTGKAIGYFKPIQTGEEDDTKTVHQLAELDARSTVPPVYHFRKPAAPYIAAATQHEVIDTSKIITQWDQCRNQCRDQYTEKMWVIEGAGGLLVPITRSQTVRELILAFDLPVLLVSSTLLGTINHTLLTLESLRSVGLNILGIVLSGKKDPFLVPTLSEFTSIPVIAQIPWLENVNPEMIQRYALEWFASNTLDRLFS